MWNNLSFMSQFILSGHEASDVGGVSPASSFSKQSVDALQSRVVLQWKAKLFH